MGSIGGQVALGGEEGGQKRVADPGFPDRVESLDGAGGQPEDDGVGRRRVRHCLPAGAPGFGALDELALALSAAIDLDDQTLQRLARQRCVALGGEIGQPGCASLSGRLRCDVM